MAIDSIKMYAAMLHAAAKFGIQQLVRKVTGKPHAKGWPPEQEWMVMLMTCMFQHGNIHHWRGLIKNSMSVLLPDLQLIKVSASTFKGPGWRDSWWVSLTPEHQPANPRASLVVMYLHGGAFMAGDPLMYQPAYRTWMKQLAAQGIHMRVFAVGYPLAPEHPFPAGLLGVAEAYDWLVQQLGGSQGLILAGDSAGGNLTLTSLLHMQQRAAGTSPLQQRPAAATAPAPQQQQQQGLDDSSAAQPAAASDEAVGIPITPVPFHPPQAAILISLAPDFSSTSVLARAFSLQSKRRPGKAAVAAGSGGDVGRIDSRGGVPDDLLLHDYIVNNEKCSVAKLYLPQPDLATSPLVSPVYGGSFDGLVQDKILVVTGGCEALAPDIHRFVEAVQTASPDVPLQHHVQPNEPHCYCVLGLPHLLEKGARVLVPVMAAAATEYEKTAAS